MASVKDMFQRASKGELSQEELQIVVARVEASKIQEDPELYLLIAILGEGGFQEYRPLVEYFLHYPSDPSIAEVAFVSLTGHWNLVGEYLDEIKTFISGVEWDTWEEVRMSAIAAAGRWLRAYEDNELLESLIRIFCNQDEDSIVREAAYIALSDAMGRDAYETLTSKMDDTVVESAKRRLRGNRFPHGEDNVSED